MLSGISCFLFSLAQFVSLSRLRMRYYYFRWFIVDLSYNLGFDLSNRLYWLDRLRLLSHHLWSCLHLCLLDHRSVNYSYRLLG